MHIYTQCSILHNHEMLKATSEMSKPWCMQKVVMKNELELCVGKKGISMLDWVRKRNYKSLVTCHHIFKKRERMHEGMLWILYNSSFQTLLEVTLNKKHILYLKWMDSYYMQCTLKFFYHVPLPSIPFFKITGHDPLNWLQDSTTVWKILLWSYTRRYVNG